MTEQTITIWSHDDLADRLGGVLSSFKGVSFGKFQAFARDRADKCPCANCLAMREDAGIIFGVAMLSRATPFVEGRVTPFEAECAQLVLAASEGHNPDEELT